MKEYKNIAIYGAGGFGRELYCMLREIIRIDGKWKFVGFFDDGLQMNSEIEYGRILGGLDQLNNWDSDLNIVFSIANCDVLSNLVSKISNPNIHFPNLVAPNVLFLDEDNVDMGKGNVLFFGARVSCNVKIGNFNILNSNVSLGHDSEIGNYNVVGPMVRISGNTKVGDSNFFGIQSVILQGLKIGYKTKIGAGSIVIRNTIDENLYMGNPAKKIILN